MSDLSLVDVQKQTTDVKYVVAMDCDETSIVVYQEEEPHWTVTVNLTCPAIRQQTDEGLSVTLSYYTNVKSDNNNTDRRKTNTFILTFNTDTAPTHLNVG